MIRDPQLSVSEPETGEEPLRDPAVPEPYADPEPPPPIEEPDPAPARTGAGL